MSTTKTPLPNATYEILLDAAVDGLLAELRNGGKGAHDEALRLWGEAFEARFGRREAYRRADVAAFERDFKARLCQHLKENVGRNADALLGASEGEVAKILFSGTHLS
jgi:hypothetical protein